MGPAVALAALAAALAAASGAAAAATPAAALVAIPAPDLAPLAEEARRAFASSYDAYLEYSFPRDELRPLSCGGSDSQGGIALTLLDSLDSLVVFNETGRLRSAVGWIEASMDELEPGWDWSTAPRGRWGQGGERGATAGPEPRPPTAGGAVGPAAPTGPASPPALPAGSPPPSLASRVLRSLARPTGPRWPGAEEGHGRAAPPHGRAWLPPPFDAAPPLDLRPDARVHVFETCIRALGGLLSAHLAITRRPELVPAYRGGLLAQARVLGTALLPALSTPTGLALSWVNPRRGARRSDPRETCTACAGTLVVEMGSLSRLTGDPRFEEAARRSAEALWARRSPIDLLGNTIDVDSGLWSTTHAGCGAGADSAYEYLLKDWLLFGTEASRDSFARAYAALVVYGGERVDGDDGGLGDGDGDEGGRRWGDGDGDEGGRRWGDGDGDEGGRRWGDGDGDEGGRRWGDGDGDEGGRRRGDGDGDGRGRGDGLDGRLEGGDGGVAEGRWAASTLPRVPLSTPWQHWPTPLDASMGTGRRLHPYAWALSAFWPGLQALAGRADAAEASLAVWIRAWRRWGGALPEMFHASLDHAHSENAGYPLRPELAESVAAAVYEARGAGEAAGRAGREAGGDGEDGRREGGADGRPSPSPLRARLRFFAGEMLRDILRRAEAPCGFAGLQDVRGSDQVDLQESFFLAETLKYLWLSLAGAEGLLGHVIFSTEAHVFYPVPAEPDAEGGSAPPLLGAAGETVPPACSAVCGPAPATPSERLSALLPGLLLDPGEAALLRRRRCSACLAVDRALLDARARRASRDRGGPRGAQPAPPRRRVEAPRPEGPDARVGPPGGGAQPTREGSAVGSEPSGPAAHPAASGARNVLPAPGPGGDLNAPTGLPDALGPIEEEISTSGSRGGRAEGPGRAREAPSSRGDAASASVEGSPGGRVATEGQPEVAPTDGAPALPFGLPISARHIGRQFLCPLVVASEEGSASVGGAAGAVAAPSRDSPSAVSCAFVHELPAGDQAAAGALHTTPFDAAVLRVIPAARLPALPEGAGGDDEAYREATVRFWARPRIGASAGAAAFVGDPDGAADGDDGRKEDARADEGRDRRSADPTPPTRAAAPSRTPPAPPTAPLVSLRGTAAAFPELERAVRRRGGLRVGGAAVAASPTSGCSAGGRARTAPTPTPGGRLISVVVRGECSFETKARVAEAGGAAGMLVLNLHLASHPLTMQPDPPAQGPVGWQHRFAIGEEEGGHPASAHPEDGSGRGGGEREGWQGAEEEAEEEEDEEAEEGEEGGAGNGEEDSVVARVDAPGGADAAGDEDEGGETASLVDGASGGRPGDSPSPAPPSASPGLLLKPSRLLQRLLHPLRHLHPSSGPAPGSALPSVLLSGAEAEAASELIQGARWHGHDLWVELDIGPHLTKGRATGPAAGAASREAEPRDLGSLPAPPGAQVQIMAPSETIGWVAPAEERGNPLFRQLARWLEADAAAAPSGGPSSGDAPGTARLDLAEARVARPARDPREPDAAPRGGDRSPTAPPTMHAEL